MYVDYIIRMGDIESNKKAYRPSSNRVADWWAEFKNTTGLENYEVYFVGNFAEKVFGTSELDTGDVDLIFVGDIKGDFDGLKHVFDECSRIGLDNHLLIDSFHNEYLYDIADPKPQIIHRGFKTWYRRFTNGREENMTWEGPEFTDLPSGLLRIERIGIPKSMAKAHARYNEGHYQGIFKNAKDAFDDDGKLLGRDMPDIHLNSDKSKLL